MANEVDPPCGANAPAIPKQASALGPLCGAFIGGTLCGASIQEVPRRGGWRLRQPIRWYEKILPTPRTTHPAYPVSQWEPWRRAQLVVVECHATNWMRSIKVPPWRNAQQQWESHHGRSELHYLWDLASERQSSMGEIVQESSDIRTPFLRLLSIEPESHPRTCELVEAAIMVAFQAVVWFKAINNRARPSQIEPVLYPPISVPPHPAYPSGHATEAHLIALCMGKVRTDLAAHELPLLARQIARNREVAGLHFPTDTEAGAKLARDLYQTMSAGSQFGRLLSEAKAEWTFVKRQRSHRQARKRRKSAANRKSTRK